MRELSLVLMAAGSVLALYSFGLDARALRRPNSARKALALLSGFRLGMLGLGAAGVGAGLFFHIEWLWVLSLIIGGEELLESSIAIAALKDQERRLAKPRAFEPQAVEHCAVAGPAAICG